jgi:hypothetical protein
MVVARCLERHRIRHLRDQPGAFKAPSTGIFGNDYVAELMKQGLSEEEVNQARHLARHRADQRDR